MKLISGIVDSGFFAQSALSAEVATKDSLGRNISETYLTTVPEGYATENWVTSQGYLTGHQSLDGLMSASLLEQSGGLITGYNGSAFAGQGGGVTGDFELSAGSGISIVDYPLEQKTVISVTAQGGNPEVEQAVIDNSATWNDVTSKADITAIPSTAGLATTGDLQTVSADITALIPSTAGLATEDWVTAQGYLTTAYTPDFAYHDSAISAIDESAIYDTSAHARINTLAGRINTLSSDKADVTALADYQTTADMVNYQTTAAMTGYQEAGEYYSASNPSGFISDVPDTYLQNTDLSTTDGKVTAISGIPLSAGGDVPEGVMVESGLEYNAVNEISAYNGSAIAQYGAEKQFIVHDDTLVHLSNSAQYALGCNISALQRLMGIDETVLWTGSLTSSLSLSESMSSFNRVRFVMHCDNNDTQINQNLIHEIEWNNGNMVTMADVVRYPATASFPIYDYRWGANIASNGKDISNVYHEMYWHAKNSWTGGGLNENAAYYPVKIIGIGRKEV